MIVKTKVFKGRRVELAVFAKHHVNLRFAIGLARGVDAVKVGLVLLGADESVLDRRENKAKKPPSSMSP